MLAIEDRRFYSALRPRSDRPGARPLGQPARRQFVQGGSTITQQAGEEPVPDARADLKRKVQELLLALWLERTFSKDQILAIYLNRAYFGAGTYGVDAAARKYFGRPANEVTMYEAAMLAGLLKAPSRLQPVTDPGRAKPRPDRAQQHGRGGL